MMQIRRKIRYYLAVVSSQKRGRLSCLLGIFVVSIAFICNEDRQKKNHPLVQAVFRDDVALVAKMLSGGADPNSINELGDTGLHMLFQSGNDVARHIQEILQLFFDYFVDVTIPNREGEEPFVYIDRIVGIPKKLSFVGELVLHGAHIDSRTKKGMTLLDLFVQTHGLPTIEAFLAWWGWLISPDTLASAKKWAALWKFTDIMKALERKDIFITEKMIQEAHPLWRHPHLGFDLLTMLVLKGDVSMLDQLLDRDVFDINQGIGSVFSQSINNSYSPSLEKEIFDFKAAETNVFSGAIDYGYTVLHLAVMQRDISLVAYLLKRGANPTRQAKNGNSPLHCVMYVDPLRSKSNIDLMVRMVTLLMENGADINATNKRGDTFLHVAIKRGATELVQRVWTNFYGKLFSNTKTSLTNLAKTLGKTDIEAILKKGVGTNSLTSEQILRI